MGPFQKARVPVFGNWFVMALEENKMKDYKTRRIHGMSYAEVHTKAKSYIKEHANEVYTLNCTRNALKRWTAIISPVSS